MRRYAGDLPSPTNELQWAVRSAAKLGGSVCHAILTLADLNSRGKGPQARAPEKEEQKPEKRAVFSIRTTSLVVIASFLSAIQ